MEKKVFAFLAVFLFFYISVSSQTSDSESLFSLDGCSMDFFTGSSESAPVGGCIMKEWYCKDVGYLQNVYYEPNACSMGRTDDNLREGENTTVICCPLSSYQCVRGRNPEDPDNYYCVPRLQDCSSYTSEIYGNEAKEICEDNQCYWDSRGDGECVPMVERCSDYTNSLDCDSDYQNISRYDFGCNVGNYVGETYDFVVPEESCKCYWDPDRDICYINSSVINAYDNSIILGNCLRPMEILTSCDETTDGFAHFVYRATWIPLLGGEAINPADVGCIDRRTQRRCVDSFVKIPFFNYINFITLFFLLFGFYSMKSKKTKFIILFSLIILMAYPVFSASSFTETNFRTIASSSTETTFERVEPEQTISEVEKQEKNYFLIYIIFLILIIIIIYFLFRNSLKKNKKPGIKKKKSLKKK